jgi:hypothetical protein
MQRLSGRRGDKTQASTPIDERSSNPSYRVPKEATRSCPEKELLEV